MDGRQFGTTVAFSDSLPASGEDPVVDSTNSFGWAPGTAAMDKARAGPAVARASLAMALVASVDRTGTKPRTPLSTTNCEQCAGRLLLGFASARLRASASIVDPCNSNSVNLRIQDCFGSAGTTRPSAAGTVTAA